MFKIFLVLVAIVAFGGYEVKDVTEYLRKEGAQFLSVAKNKASLETITSKTLEPGRKSGYRLKASQRS